MHDGLKARLILGLIAVFVNQAGLHFRAGEPAAADFQWRLGDPVLEPLERPGDTCYSLKDPSVVYHEGRWHLFCSIRGQKRSHQIEYVSFESWDAVDRAERHVLRMHDGFFCAPQVFYFRPHGKWYLICQASDPSWDPEYGAAYATTSSLADPASWSPLAPLGHRKADGKSGLDFWIIADERKAHLFFTTLDGRMWREETSIEDFPRGWSEPHLALKADIFEASHIYRLKEAAFGETARYLGVIEAQHGHGWRYFKAYLTDRLDGTWTPLAATKDGAFASMRNTRFQGARWTDSISHGELLRAGYDERLEIDPDRLRFVFQGVTDERRKGKPYGRIPWRLGLLEAAMSPEDTEQPARAASGPLRVHPENPRYFVDGRGRVVYLTGSHTWASLVDIGPGDPPPAFDFDAYLDFLERHDHNFIRLWTWELTSWDTRNNSRRYRKERAHTAAPHPYRRTGPGVARDGKPKFDLEQFDPDYFTRLRSRVEAAGRRGIYVSVMLFEGWGMQFSPGGWETHPFHPDNNVQGLSGDANGDGKGLEVHTLKVPAITRLQEAYVRKVIDTVGDLDNVLYEISNENHPPSTRWQAHMIELIHSYERERPKQHPVGMTFQYRGGKNETLFESPADWISPNAEGGYRDDPPVATGRKVVLSDTDHLWGIGGSAAWVWKSFLRGYHPIFMDPYDGTVLGQRFNPKWEPLRRSMGYTRKYAERMDLAAMTPRGDLSSTRFCLANPGSEYLVYLPDGGKATVDLTGASRKLSYHWFDPSSGKATKDASITGGGKREFTAPFEGHGVLYVR